MRIYNKTKNVRWDQKVNFVFFALLQILLISQKVGLQNVNNKSVSVDEKINNSKQGVPSQLSA